MASVSLRSRATRSRRLRGMLGARSCAVALAGGALVWCSGLLVATAVAAPERVASDDEVHEKPFAPGQVAISSGSVTLWASRAPDGRLAVRARAVLRVRRPIVAQVTVAPCNAFINPLSATPETPIRVFSGRNLVKSVRLRPGSRTIRLSGRVTSDAAGDPFPRRWTDCAVATVLDEREVGRPSVAVPARQGDALFRSGAVVTLTVTRPDGSIAEV